MFNLKLEQSDVLHTKWGTARVDSKGYYRITSRRLEDLEKEVKNRGLE